MTKQKRKLTPAEKARKKLMREKYEWVFLNGRQKRIKRAPTIEGLPAEEFIRRNADPIWLVQNEMYEELHEWEQKRDQLERGEFKTESGAEDSDELPF